MQSLKYIALVPREICSWSQWLPEDLPLSHVAEAADPQHFRLCSALPPCHISRSQGLGTAAVYETPTAPTFATCLKLKM